MAAIAPLSEAEPASGSEVIDLTAGRLPRGRGTGPAPPRPRGVLAADGIRIRRIRLRSLAGVAAVFCVLGYLTIVGTLVALWNVALLVGAVDSIEGTVTSALGLDEPFEVVGAELLPAVLWGALLLVLAGWVLAMLLALVYNAASAIFGGVAVETGPLCRRTAPQPRAAGPGQP